MATLTKIGTTVNVVATLSINEQELMALDALRGYGIDTFLKVFYEHLGTSYLKPHEDGLRSFFSATAGAEGICDEARECRQYMAEAAAKKVTKQRWTALPAMTDDGRPSRNWSPDADGDTA